MKATLYTNGVRSQWATKPDRVHRIITLAFIRIRRGENVRLEIN
jgi:hypothetical protein